MNRFFKIVLWALPLFVLGVLWYLSSHTKEESPYTPAFLNDSFYASTVNDFSKYPAYPILISITSLDDKTLIAVGDNGVILKSTDKGESFKATRSGAIVHRHS